MHLNVALGIRFQLQASCPERRRSFSWRVMSCMTQSDGMIVTKKAKAEGHLSTRPHSSLATLTSHSAWGLNVSTCRISNLLKTSHP